MKQLCSFLFAMILAAIPCTAQPIFTHVNSVEYLAGNSSLIAIGTIDRHEDFKMPDRVRQMKSRRVPSVLK